MHFWIACLFAGTLPLLLGACASAPDPATAAADEAVHSEFVAALQAPELQEGDIQQPGATGDYWETGTLTSVDDDGRVVFRVPTSLVEGNGVDAYANRQAPEERYQEPFRQTFYPNDPSNPLLTPNALHNRGGYQMTLGTSSTRPQSQPQPTAAPAPRPSSVSAPRPSPRPMRTPRTESRQSRE